MSLYLTANMYLANSLLFICLFSTVKCLSIFGHRDGLNYLLKEFNKTGNLFDSSLVETEWIEQPLDHFNKTDERKWKMRYLQRLDMWQTGGPIYLFIGGEWRIDSSFLTTGTPYELAKETNGALFYSEHRYYGDSKPFEDLTPENLRDLSSRQALADIVRLLESFKKRPEFLKSKVVVVGGSYAANLAAWLKLLYPDLVDAAIASSGPVKAKTDFYEYLETVSDDFEQYGSPECYKKIEQKFKEYERKFGTEDGIRQLKEEENICFGTDMTKLENKQLFFLHKLSVFTDTSQKGDLNSIKELCELINSNSRIFSSADESTIMWNKKFNCWDCDFNSMIQSTRNDDSDMAWTYQTCTEFGYFQTTASNNQPFTKNVPVDFFFKMCTALFGKEFDEKRVEEGVKKTNAMYGGLHPNVSKVVFVNGELDPWHRLSVLEDISYEAPAKVIPFSSHCRDLLSDQLSDPEELKEARRYIKHLVKKWIGAGEYASTSRGNNNMSVTVFPNNF